jgi:hypothetical protein
MLLFKELLERLFHAQKWLPPETDKYYGKVYPLRYSQHAMQAAKNDRYGEIDLMKIPRSVKIERGQVIEVETDDLTGQIRKFVVRRPYDEKRDIIIVFLVPDGTVKTVWFNLKSDTHRTLNRGRYASAPLQAR